jgi:CcmD family protein
MELSEAVKYVAAAYLVVWLAILVYVILIGQKVGRLEADLDRLEAQLEQRGHERPAASVTTSPIREPRRVSGQDPQRSGATT